MGSEGWFDDSKLLEGERIVRRCAARLRVDVAPHWWEGELVLTNERLMFFARVDNPSVHDVAFWLTDVLECGGVTRNRMRVAARYGEPATFEIDDPPASVRALFGRSSRPWIRLIATLRGMAHEHPLDDTTLRRAAG